MFGLTEKEISLMKTVFEKYSEVVKVKIYGSRAMGNHRANSDVDFALWGEIDRHLVGKISRELDELPLPYTYDVTDYASVDHEALKRHIDKFGKVFFNRESIYGSTSPRLPE